MESNTSDNKNNKLYTKIRASVETGMSVRVKFLFIGITSFINKTKIGFPAIISLSIF